MPQQSDAAGFHSPACECCGGLGLRLSRRGLFGAALAGTAIAHELAAPTAWAQAAATLPGRGEFVIRGGYVLTVDPAQPDLPTGDVHVRDGVIVAIAETVEAPPGAEIIDARRMIVMPGLIDTHWHVWNSLQRNWLTDEAGYMATKNATAKHYSATDFYNSSRLAFAEALNAGVTSTYNYAHNVISPEHAAAEMKAHEDSGIRGVYGYGSPDLHPEGSQMDIDDFKRVHREWARRSSREKDLVRLGVALRGPRSTTSEVFDLEMKTARELGAPIIFHGGQSVRATASTAELKQKGYLSPNLTLVHFILATPQDRENMAANGVSLSYTTEGELKQRVGDAGGQLLHMAHAGVNVSLSFDGNSISPVDLFSSMRIAWDIATPKEGTSTEMLAPLKFMQCLEMGTINGARALGLDKITGSLTPGKRADIILLRADDLNMVPFANVDCAIVRSATPANVDSVIVDGRVVKRGGRLTGVDVEAVKRAAAASAYAIRQKAGGRLAPKTGVAPAY
ncbi:MAG: 5-methylthioadenosine/S-adenosylhomocysteine deaminase [Hyphomicrobiales bacterium]|nr:5-methylthioadenosine/S-adenosylhomocysteine deaminase [Hyphomicrobiales bacterium]